MSLSDAPGHGRNGLDLEDFFENGTVGLHLVGPDGTILRANPADYAPLGYSAEEYVGRNITDFHADPETIADILARLSRGEKLDKYPARLKAKDGSVRHVQISSSVNFRDGDFVNTRCFTVDVTDRRDAEDALREAQQRLSATYESVLAGIGEVDRDAHWLRVNEAFCEITGYTREELLQRSVFELTHPDDVEADRTRWEAQVRGELDRYAITKRYVHKDGRVIWVEVTSSTVRDAAGGFRYGVRLVHDVTERREAEARQNLLLEELNHRVKNTLATVQSMAAQTARSCTTADEFRVRFEARLLALSAAHDRLTRNQWEGARMKEIAEEELAHHRAGRRDLVARGPDVMLPPRAALSLSMALHELATNAAKYGALSTEGGRVSLTWTVARDGPFPERIDLLWDETGGPPVAPPDDEGFGSRLLRVTARELGGEAAADFRPQGLRWTLSFPLRREETSAG
ncbi:MAG TPA: PAS domain S-box protein [Caulobacteraceae bacterium]|jgi:PAS domain S-box-containing protein